MKPGYKTTEFWISLLIIVGSSAFAVADKLPARYASWASSVAGAAYMLARGLAKVFPPKPGP